jgi:hypothetical protein
MFLMVILTVLGVLNLIMLVGISLAVSRFVTNFTRGLENNMKSMEQLAAEDIAMREAIKQALQIMR